MESQTVARVFEHLPAEEHCLREHYRGWASRQEEWEVDLSPHHREEQTSPDHAHLQPGRPNPGQPPIPLHREVSHPDCYCPAHQQHVPERCFRWLLALMGLLVEWKEGVSAHIRYHSEVQMA